MARAPEDGATAAIRRYRQWLIEQALPLWGRAGYSAEHGRFHERLDFEARAVEVPHRVMVQARQIHVFAEAARVGWYPDGAGLSEAGMNALIRDFVDRSGGRASVAFSIDAAGAVVSPVRDSYAHAFVLLALAGLHRLNGDPKLLVLADEIIAFVEAALTDADHGGIYNRFPVDERTKSQNPHMHLLEAYLALDRAAPGRAYLERAHALVRLFKAHLFRSGDGVLLEYRSEQWSDHPDSSRADVVEPGHHFEWVWLLAEYRKRTGAAIGRVADPLHDFACRHGRSERGLIYDQVAPDGRVLKNSHRVWPHTEALKAAAARRHAGDPEAATLLGGEMARLLLDRFLNRPFSGAWMDHVAASGEPLVGYVPASTLYHLFQAAAAADRFLAGS